MRQVLAIARLRFREGLAAQLALLAPLALVGGIGFALWAPGGTDAARAAVADRTGFGIVNAVALLVALVLPCLGFPGDLRRKRGLTLAAAPVTRFALVLGGSVGYGVLASAVLLAATAGTLLGLEAGGLGAGARAGTHPYVAIGAGVGDETVQVDAAAPRASVRFRVPDGYRSGDLIPVRLRPVGLYQEGEDFQVAATLTLTVGGHDPLWPEPVRVGFHPSEEVIASVPLNDVGGGEEATLRIERGSGWKLRFDPGTIEVGEPAEWFALSALKAALCLVPLLFVAAAAANCAAVRFNAPTSAGLALGLLAVFAGQDVLLEASQAVERRARESAHVDDGHTAADGHHHHGGGDVTWLQVAVARGVGALANALPADAPFDRTGDLVEGVAVPASAPVRAAVGALPSFLVLTAAGWLLLRRRELIPRP